MTEFTQEEQLTILEILYTLKMKRLPRDIVADEMDLSDEEMFKILDKAVEILNKQAKEQAN
jgi:hypothetical protein